MKGERMSDTADCAVCMMAMDKMPRLPLDPCITSLVLALNAAGFRTAACCCGHGVRPASVIFEDGRELLILRNWAEARTLDHMWPPIHGAERETP